MTIHSNEKPFACHLCSKRFKQKRHLKYHQKIHEFKHIDASIDQITYAHYDGASPLTIQNDDEANDSNEPIPIPPFVPGPKLSKYFNFKNMLCYQCKHCPKLFAQKRDLYRHERTHLHMYQCGICQKKFKIEQNLRVHMKTHSLKGNRLFF